MVVQEFENKSIKKEASGTGVIQQILQNVFFQGVRQVPQLPYSVLPDVELARHILFFIKSKVGTYHDWEVILKETGYPTNAIRKTFKALTGIDPKLLYDVNLNLYLKTPPTIPGLNLGWGVAKDKERADYLYIMPWLYGFSVFAQKGDLQRTEDYYTTTFDDAKNYLVTNCTDYVFPEPDVFEKEKSFPLERERLTERFANDEKYLKIANFLYHSPWPDDEKLSFIENLLKKNAISTEQAKDLIKFYIKKPEIGKFINKIYKRSLNETKIEKNIAEELKERTPEQFFEREIREGPKELAPSQVKIVTDYINKKFSKITGYTFGLYSLKYQPLHVKTVGEEPREIEAPFGKVAISVILELKKIATGQTKYILLVFLLTDTEMLFPDIFKSETENIYALTQEGIDTCFSEN